MSKKSQNDDLPISAFCSSEQQMSFCKTVFMHCFVALRQRELSWFFFFWIIIWDWCWSNLLALKAFLQGHRSVSNAGRSEDVRFQNQEVLAATTAWRSESDPNLFSAGMSSGSLILTGLSHFGTHYHHGHWPSEQDQAFFFQFFQLATDDWDVLDQHSKRQDGHQSNFNTVND